MQQARWPLAEREDYNEATWRAASFAIQWPSAVSRPHSIVGTFTLELQGRVPPAEAGSPVWWEYIVRGAEAGFDFNAALSWHLDLNHSSCRSARGTHGEIFGGRSSQ